MKKIDTRFPDSDPHSAVVTGATGGIGREIVSLLLSKNYRVFVLSRHAENVREQFPDWPDRIIPVPCDLTSEESIQKVSEYIRQKKIVVNLLIHCAGLIHPEDSSNITASYINSQMMINLTGPILLTGGLVSSVPSGGHILFVNSVAGVLPLQGSSVYTASKFGLRGFARSLALDLRPRRIRVSSVFLGAVDTLMLDREIADGGSVLNFVSQPLSPRRVAEFILRASQKSGQEFFLPRIDGVFGHACLMMPWLLRWMTPFLQIIGRSGQNRYLRKKG
ncbi:SDR family NAD(P)-dependent oxidoreductase [Gluconobacter morbifer]|uniref:Short chain alcohol dehydrogenase n=1 Tax=Gluconobacter morbifer G707 TaxID=1088869 RepID=G6XJ05_9PROT|nr:SDR family NAD(P)-dependent oxidoreductase [Gluconobacter morbifer]EHH68253.1 short chain alcohol dehydrogenase [Gluconobacter morbifer G707]